MPSRIFVVACLFVMLLPPAWAESSSEPPSVGVPASSKSKAFNPDISANFLGLLAHGNSLTHDWNDFPREGLSLQEAELQFTADVDPYLRAVALFSVAPDTKNAGKAAAAPAFGIDPEEVFMETISLPNVTLRAGKFKLAMGKHNQLHTHAYPFIDAPLIHRELLGEEGLNEAAVSAAFLLPTDWYSEVIVQGFSPSNEALYLSPSSGDWGGLLRLKNLWDLSDDLTLELGLSGSAGKNQFDRTASVVGADLSFKWRPAEGGKYHALVWWTEYLEGNRLGTTINDPLAGIPIERLGGIATWLQYQFAERWWVQARYEHVGMPASDGFPKQNKESALLGFFPSEFSGFRLQYDHLRTEGAVRHEHTVALQYNISIGAHPAHAY